MYNDKLSNIFSVPQKRIGAKRDFPQDKNGKSWGHEASEILYTRKEKIFYAVGCSWLDSVYFNRVFLNDYPEYFLINKSIRGLSNAIILDLLKQDIEMLKSFNIDIVFLISFSEVGRTITELQSCNPGNYSSAHEYFGSILKNQYTTAKNIIGNYPNYITTSFITNNFNDKLSILDFCSKTKKNKPQDAFRVNPGIIEFLKEKNSLFKFDLVDALNKSIELRDFIESNDYVVELHPGYYKVYEDFLENVFSNLD